MLKLADYKTELIPLTQIDFADKHMLELSMITPPAAQIKNDTIESTLSLNLGGQPRRTIVSSRYAIELVAERDLLHD